MLNLVVVGAGVLMAMFYPNVGSIIRCLLLPLLDTAVNGTRPARAGRARVTTRVSCRFSGATCGLALVFVLPSLVRMKSLRRRGLLRWPSVLVHGVLILLGAANLLAQFRM